jgi:Ni,Fe-hydrogenase III small subunit
MVNAISCLFRKRVTGDSAVSDDEIEMIGRVLRCEIDRVFGHSLMIRELDTGSDNATEIEINNLTNPFYDAERFGISFVASPRHADVLMITGAITNNMVIAAQKTYEAMPSPKFVIAVGDDACSGGIFKGTYGVLGGVETLFPVDVKITGNPPAPAQILAGLLALMKKANGKQQ